MLYLETQWASLIAFEKGVDWWKEVLPVAEATIRRRSAKIGMR
jgi:hypothetical protein